MGRRNECDSAFESSRQAKLIGAVKYIFRKATVELFLLWFSKNIENILDILKNRKPSTLNFQF